MEPALGNRAWRLFWVNTLAIAVVVVAACGGGIDLDEGAISSQASAASRDIETYSFRAEWNFKAGEEGLPDEEWQVLDLEATGQFQVPDKLLVSFGPESRWIGEDMEFTEIIYDGEAAFGRPPESDEWETSDGVRFLSLLQVVPSLGEILGKLREIGEFEALSDEDLDEVRTHHFKGDLFPRFIDRPLMSEESGTMEIWMGKDDSLIRRAKYKITNVQSYPEFLDEAPQILERDVDIYFFDYNEPVTIEAPDM